jgi:hypothetical protein
VYITLITVADVKITLTCSLILNFSADRHVLPLLTDTLVFTDIIVASVLQIVVQSHCHHGHLISRYGAS